MHDGSEAAEEERAAAALFERARFRHPWRAYQLRVLEALSGYLDDSRLHVVAPPGSGKTALGLEVLRRLGKPALVLAPTRTVRDQWLARFTADFLGGETAEGLLSSDPTSPAVLTVSTYQALWSYFRRDGGRPLISALRGAGVRVLAVDECHHLRDHWWRCLTWLVVELPNRSVIALTATPPYDVPAVEWNRYLEFCGPVDEEISIPELVLENTLCPHQDLVYLDRPEAEVVHELGRFDEEVRSLVGDLALDLDLARLLGRDPALLAPGDHLDRVLDGADYFLAVVVYLHALTPEVLLPLISAMDLDEVRLPEFDRDWAQALLQGLLFGSEGVVVRELPDSGPRLAALRKRLADLGAVERRRVDLRTTRRIRRLLGEGPGKLRSVVAVVELEVRYLGPDLRCVVLTDYIRRRAFPGPDGLDRPLTRIGVVPIFEALRRVRLPGVGLAILTGDLIVVPADQAGGLLELARWQDPAVEIGLTALDHDPAYVRVEVRPGLHGRCVEWVTRLFGRGGLHVLVGTAALLGEGWDAPAVNTLVLASVVGSYVTSNQMRGRAIRVEHGNPLKTANIWHLATVMPEVAAGAEELATLARRFEAFVGLTHDRPVISSGFERLGLGGELGAEEVAAVNARMAARATERGGLADAWRGALVAPTARQLTLRYEADLEPRLLRPALLARVGRLDAPWWLAVVEGWWARFMLRRIAQAVGSALAWEGLLPEEFDKSWVRIVRGVADSTLRVGLAQGSYVHQTRFVAAVEEVFDLLADPRYLLRVGKLYWAVPSQFGVRRLTAQHFAGHWRRRLGPAELIFTRNPAARSHRLWAKEQALLNRFAGSIRVRSRWG